MLVEPATGDHSDTIKSCYTGLCEDSGKKVANDASDCMASEDLNINDQLTDFKPEEHMSHIESVVIVKYEFELGSKITCSSADDAKENGGWGTHETRGGRNGNKA